MIITIYMSRQKNNHMRNPQEYFDVDISTFYSGFEGCNSIRKWC